MWTQTFKFFTQYVARSAMEDAISSGILRGRPFGGVSIAWSPKINGAVKPLTNFPHKRVVGVDIDSETKKTLIIRISICLTSILQKEKNA